MVFYSRVKLIFFSFCSIHSHPSVALVLFAAHSIAYPPPRCVRRNAEPLHCARAIIVYVLFQGNGGALLCGVVWCGSSFCLQASNLRWTNNAVGVVLQSYNCFFVPEADFIVMATEMFCRMRHSHVFLIFTVVDHVSISLEIFMPNELSGSLQKAFIGDLQRCKSPVMSSA